MALSLLGVVALVGFFYLRSTEPAGIVVDGTRLAESDLERIYADLCRTRALAATSVPEAGDLFFSRVHSPLHVIARAVEEADRPRAARLLESKNDVERALNEGAGPPQAAAALDRLLNSTSEGLRSVGVTTSTCETPRPL